MRELAHEIERALVFEGERGLAFVSLSQRGEGTDSSETDASMSKWMRAAFVFPESGFSLEVAINELVQRALQQAGGNVSAAARLLGVTRDYVRYRLKEQPSDPAGLSAEVGGWSTRWEPRWAFPPKPQRNPWDSSILIGSSSLVRISQQNWHSKCKRVGNA